MYVVIVVAIQRNESDDHQPDVDDAIPSKGDSVEWLMKSVTRFMGLS
jgi:hypothetical protein